MAQVLKGKLLSIMDNFSNLTDRRFEADSVNDAVSALTKRVQSLELEHKPNCQLTWIEELMPPLLTPERKEAYLKRQMTDVEEWFESCENLVTPTSSILNIRLTLAALCGWLGDFEKALEWTEDALKHFGELPVATECSEHLRAYEYLIRANFYMISDKMMNEIQAKGENAADLEMELWSMAELWKQGGRSFQSVIAVARGSLAKSFRCQDTYINHLREAISLDPHHSEWYRLLYKALRLQRREIRAGLCPSQEEKEVIKKAYELEPNCCLNQSCYAGWLEENSSGYGKGRGLLVEETRKEAIDKAIQLMLKALQANPEDRWTHVRLAEIYAYGFYSHLDRLEGKRRFESCLERWPESSMVKHKFGRYFLLNKEEHVALRYFTEAIDCNVGNYPCLMDYLKCAQRVDTGYEKMLSMINKCADHELFFPVPFMKIMVMKGLLLWTISADDDLRKEEACHAWIDASMKSPSLRRTTAKCIISGNLDVINVPGISSSEVVTVLTRILAQLGCGQDAKRKAVKNLINELSGKSNSMPFPLRQRTTSMCSVDSYRSTASSTSSYVTAQSSWSSESSLADFDPCWRRGSSPSSSPVGSPPARSSRSIFAGYQGHPPVVFAPYLGDQYYATQAVQVGRSKTGRKDARARSNCSVADNDNDWRR